ncbi:hypothetical protein QCA50_014983 [Cerrena zonata]|uniref:Zn(2)-C6 fungal-type domain-containing protein n=1 Tax=Cerrena zonata TaxID=2478898 RepID=A0AAW0FR23_9APHY
MERFASADAFNSGTGTTQVRRQPTVAGTLITTTGLPTIFTSTIVADHRVQPGEGGPFTANWQPSVSSSSPSPSTTSTTRSSSVQTSQSNQPAPSMIAPPMYYEHGQAEAQGEHEFQRWVQSYGQGHFTFTANPTPGMATVPQMTFDPQLAQHPQPDMTSTSLHGLESNVQMQPPSQDQFFVTDYPVAGTSGNPSGYNQPFVPNRAHNPTSIGPHNTARRVQPQFSSAEYATQQGFPQQEFVQGTIFPPHHQQAQLPQTTRTQGNSGNQIFYNSIPNTANQQSHLTYSTFGQGSDHLAVPSSYTPSSDTTAPPSSMSPSSFGGTDDGQSFHSRTSPQPSTVTPSVAPASQQIPVPNMPKRDRSVAKPKGKQPNPKRARQESESGSDDEDDGADQPTVPPLKGPSPQTRLPGACTHCKKLKMKCDFPKDENTCKRCKQSGHHCIVEGRKPRNTPNKREYLLAQIRQKDAVIESLLRQLHNPYVATPMSIASYRMATSPSDQNNQNVLAWLERMEASVQTAGTSAGLKAFQLDSRSRTEDPAEDVSDDDTDDGVDDPTERGTQADQDAGDDEKLYSLPDSTVPIGLIARVSLSDKRKLKGREQSQETEDDDDLGVANETYFVPGPAYDLRARADLIQQYSPPEIIVHGLVTPDDVTKLFEIFYARLNPHVSLLDPVLHTPQSTFARCPFLFTVVCAVASRFYAAKSEIYPIAMHFAKHAAANALITGWKSVELAQAYFLLSIFGTPAKRWEEDRSWLYIGLAIRLATDLNLQKVSTVKPTSEHHEREILNRTRLWINCYNLDRSLSTQYGKPYSIKEDYVIRSSSDWYKKSKYNDPLDVGLCSYNALLRLISRFHDEVFDPSEPSGLNEHVNFLQLAQEYDIKLDDNFTEWVGRYRESTDLADPACALRMTLLPFVTNYARLVMYSFAFQNAFKRGLQAEDKMIIDKCFECARDVINGMIHELAPCGFMRYSPDGHFVFATFASAFLLKLLRRDFIPFITNQRRDEIFNLIGGLIDVLNSPEIAVDERHTPRLHARFLAQLLGKHRRNVSRVDPSRPPYPPQGQMAGGPPGPHATQAGPSSTTTGHVLSAPPPQGGATGGQGMGHSQGTSYRDASPTGAPMAPSVEPGYVSFDPAEFGTEMEASYGEELFPGPLQIFKSPTYWQNALMPGFNWPEGYNSMTNGFSSLQPAAVSMG